MDTQIKYEQRLETFDKAMAILMGRYAYDAVQSDLYDEVEAADLIVEKLGSSRDDAEYFAMAFTFIERWAEDAPDGDLDKLANDYHAEACEAQFGSEERIKAARLFAQVRAEMERRNLPCRVMPCWNCQTEMQEIRSLTNVRPEYECPNCYSVAIQYQEGGWGFHAKESEG